MKHSVQIVIQANNLDLIDTFSIENAVQYLNTWEYALQSNFSKSQPLHWGFRDNAENITAVLKKDIEKKGWFEILKSAERAIDIVPLMQAIEWLNTKYNKELHFVDIIAGY